MSDKPYRKLLEYLRRTQYLRSSHRVLGWDQETYMPRHGAELRAQQLAALSGVVHQRKTSKRLRRLLDKARKFAERQGKRSKEAANVREARRDLERATRVPVELVEERARVCTLARRTWVEARQAGDFAMFRPWLEKIVDLSRRWADAVGYEDHPFDALVDEYEPGESAAHLRELFAPLREALTGLVGRILDRGKPVDASVLQHPYPVEAQRAFAVLLCRSVGFDFGAGRMDDTTHPFCSGIGPGDVRITSRWDERNLLDGIFTVLHEVGHGLYEQNLDAEQFGAPVGQSCSLGVHESQSRLWENLVGRSHGFWRHFFPVARDAFPEALGGVELDDFYRAINEVRPSLIRVDADEVTYNLHIFLRFELEQELLTGELDAGDLPAAWNDRCEAALRVRPKDDRAGCLQDVHWSAGLFGYFPTYTLGNLYAAQIFRQAQEELGDLDEAFGRGEFAPLLAWLGKKIYRQGRRYRPRKLLQEVTGAPPSHEALLSHLETKYGRVYGL